MELPLIVHVRKMISNMEHLIWFKMCRVESSELVIGVGCLILREERGLLMHVGKEVRTSMLDMNISGVTS